MTSRHEYLNTSMSARKSKSEATELVKMSTLAKLSGVPAATIKHYLREGLLPPPAKRTSRNMAFYDPELVGRIQSIKALQREHFLPLKVIKDMMDEGHAMVESEVTTAASIAKVLQRSAPKHSRSRAELLEGGVAEADLEMMKALKLVAPDGSGSEEEYSGDDLELLRLLGKARKVGISPEMLPTNILADYLEAIRALVRTELALFRTGVVPLAGESLGELAEDATELSEQLVVLIRRRLLLPTLRQLGTESAKGKPAKKKAGKVTSRKR
ncbi:MAG: MerR family transcriptional regulator [Polyangiaceae bacterium]